MSHFALVLILAFVFLLILLVRHKFSYWRRNGFPELKPTIPFGCMLPFVRGQKSALLSIADTYDKISKPFFGIYVFWSPQLMVKDLALLRRILKTDFEYFHDRDAFIDEVHDPISVNIFSQRGMKWKKMRQLYSTLFSTNRLREMYPYLRNELTKLEKQLEGFAARNEDIKLKDLIAGYSVNFIANVFYGAEVDTVIDPTNKFKQIFNMIGHPDNFIDVFRQASSFFFPEPLKLFHMHCLPRMLSQHLIDAVQKTVSYRESNNVRRHDLLQVLIDQRKLGTTNLSIEEMAGNIFVFFFAGNETASNAATYCLYELCKNPALYKKAQMAVRRTLDNHNNELTFDAVREINYIDLCIKEVRRTYTGFATVNRLVSKDYPVPEHDGVVLKKGTTVLLPYGPLHMDEKYFAKPLEFMPERFEKGSGMANEEAFFPFGMGPRNCIAFRMGWVQAKALIMTVLSRFDLELVSQGNLGFDSYSLELIHKKPITVKCKLSGF